METTQKLFIVWKPAEKTIENKKGLSHSYGEMLQRFIKSLRHSSLFSGLLVLFLSPFFNLVFLTKSSSFIRVILFLVSALST